MRIDSSGRVGIGMTPSDFTGYMLQISGTTQAFMSFGNSTTGTGALNGMIIGNDGTGADIYQREAQPLRFHTSNTERMRIDSSGNVGLNETNPSSYSSNATTLHIKGRVASKAGAIRLRSSDNSIDAFVYPDATNGMSTGTLSNHSYRILTNSTERMRIDSSGIMYIMGATPSTDNSLQMQYNSTAGSAEISAKSTSGNTHFEFYTSNAGTTSERMRITSGGDILIGKTTFTADSLRIDGNGIISTSRTGTSEQVHHNFFNGNGLVGTIATTSSSTAYNTSSDYRLKEDLKDFRGLDMVSKIPVYDFKWKADDNRSYGVMAHELEEVLPQAVTGEKDAEEMQSVDYSKIVPLLVKSIQELKKEIEILKSK